MVIAIFGESCTGKSSLAEELRKRTDAAVYTGKDYSRLAKNEDEAKRKFAELLRSNAQGGDVIIYVITEREHLSLLPEKAVRVLATAGLEVIKERFARRTNGNLPAPVAAMLERKHGLFDNEPHDFKAESDKSDIGELCGEILAAARGTAVS